MRQSNEVPVGKLGIRLNQAHIAALGLQAGAVAWGQWVEGRGGRERLRIPPLPDDIEPDPKNFDPACQGPHLVVSSLHPDIWPSALRIDVRLNREHASLRRFLGTLKSLGVSILALHSKISGFQLLTLELYVELPGLTAAVNSILAKIKPDVEALIRVVTGERQRDLTQEEKDMIDEHRFRIRQRAFQDVGKHVLAISTLLELHIRRVNLDSHLASNDFLHQPSHVMGPNSWFLSPEHLPGVALCKAFADEAGLSLADSSPTRNDLRALVDELRRFAANFTAKQPIPNNMALDDPAFNLDLSLSEATTDLCTRNFRSHSKPAIRVRGLPTLAYARVWRAFNDADHASPRTPYPVIKFALKGRLLEVQPEDRDEGDAGTLPTTATPKSIPVRFAEITRSPLEEVAQWKGRWPAFASFDSEERSMRLRLLRPAFGRRYAWEMDFRYTITKADSRNSCESFAGVLDLICGAIIANADHRIERISNSLLEVKMAKTGGIELERGQVCLAFVCAKPPSGPDFEAQERTLIQNAIKGAVTEITRSMPKICIDVDWKSFSLIPLLDSLERNG